MFGLPGWAWALLVVVVAVVLRVRAYYTSFRAACRRAREELTALIPREFPGVEVTGERLGNLVLRTPDDPEVLFELADLYADVARLPGMGADPTARYAVYRQYARQLLASHLNPTTPVTLETHGDYLMPQLEAGSGTPGLCRELTGTGLCTYYLFKLPGGNQLLQNGDREKLGLTQEQLHERALANLGRDFPMQMLETVAEGEGSALQFSDGFDAARILLLPRFLKEGQSLLALIPHRDMLLLLPADMESDPERLEEGMRLLTEEHGHHPLIRLPIRVTRAGYEVVELPGS